MEILRTQLTSNRYQPSFGYRLPKGLYSSPYHLPNLCCAKCGEKMLSYLQKHKFLDSLKASSKQAIQDQIFDNVRSTESFQILVNMAKEHSRKPLDVIVNLPQNKKIIKKLTEQEQLSIKDIVSISQNITKKSSIVIKKLLPYRNLLPQIYQDILDYMTIYAAKYPEETFYNIFNKPEILDFHLERKIAIQKQNNIFKNFIFENMEKLGKNLPENKQPELETLINNLRTVLEHKETQISKQIRVSILCQDFLNNLEDKKLSKKIEDLVHQLSQLNRTNHHKIINHFANRTDRDILIEIIENFSSSFEHVVPKSQNGSNKINNGIYLCGKCNKERANLPYTTMIKFFPDFINNIQKQINKVMLHIIHGNLPENYDEYPLLIKNTLSKVSRNEININIDKYIKKKNFIVTEELNKKRQDYNSEKKLFDKTQNNIDKLYAEIFILKNKIKKITNLIKQNTDKQDKITSKLEEIKKSLDYLTSLKDDFEKYITVTKNGIKD